MVKRLPLPVVLSLLLLTAAIAPAFFAGTAAGDLTNPGILTNRGPIVITDNAGFNASNGVVGGSGTSGDPYIIKDWSIKTQTGTGISISGSDVYFIIRNCWVYNGSKTNNDCVKFDDVSNGVVENCRFENSANGVYLFDCTSINVSSSSFKNLVSGIVLGGSSGVGTIQSEVYNNAVTDCSDSAIINTVARENELERNTISNCPTGVENTGSDNVIIYNTISNCTSQGMTIRGSNNEVRGNSVHHNLGRGLYFRSPGATLQANQIYNNAGHGIFFDFTYNTDVLDNLVNDNGNCGGYIDNSNRITFRGNIISNNANQSIRITSSSSEMFIDHNHFTNNNKGANQARDEGGDTEWDDGSEGNWWSDHTTPDINDDGIVDDAYTIPGGSGASDRYPLTEAGGSDMVNISTTPVTTATEDVLYSVDFDATGSTTYVWSVAHNTSWLSINPSTGELTGTPLNADVGTAWANVTVQGGLGSTDFKNFTITISNVNDAPVWKDVPADGFIDKDSQYSFDVNATDVDAGTVLSYGVSANPATGILIDADGVITWSADVSGSFYINLSATDGHLTIYHEFRIDVLTDNNQPLTTLKSPGNNSKIDVLNPTLDWTVYDKDGESVECELFLSMSLSDVQNLAPAARLIRLAVSTYTVTEALLPGNTYYWTVIPYDAEGKGECISRIFNFVTSSDATFNHPPSFQSSPPTTASVGKEWTYSPVVNDEDGDNITMSIDAGPSGLSLEDGVLTWRPIDNQLGNHTVILNASDGRVVIHQEFTISVSPYSGPDDDTEDDDNTTGRSNMMFLFIIPLAIILLVIIIIVGVLIFRKGGADTAPPPPGESIDAEVSDSDVFDEKKIDDAKPKKGKAKPMVIDQDEEEGEEDVMTDEPELTASPDLAALDAAPEPGALLALPPAKIFEAHFEGGPRIDEIFLITKEGMLLHHFSYQDTTLVDKDILSAMLTVIQNFVTDSFGKEENSLKNLGFGDFHILIVPGKVLSAVVISPDKNIDTKENSVNRMLQEIEDNNSENLTDWDGDKDKIIGLEGCVEKLVNDGY